MSELLLVDGSNLLFQMFYGMPARIIGAQGQPIHGTLGFVGALLKIIRMTNCTHIAVLFDGEYTSFRQTVDREYKANRVDYSLLPVDQTPFSQLPDIFKALDLLGICWQETCDCEADDWIAGYVARYAGEYRITIVSQDSDLFQLIGDDVRILRYRGRKSALWDDKILMQKLGVRPGQYVLYKALTGDSSDNIHGVPKVGPKTAAKLADQFETLEDILTNADRIGQKAIRSAVLENLQTIRKNYELIKLNGEVALPFPADQLKFTETDLTTTEVLRRIGVK